MPIPKVASQLEALNKSSSKIKTVKATAALNSSIISDIKALKQQIVDYEKELSDVKALEYAATDHSHEHEHDTSHTHKEYSKKEHTHGDISNKVSSQDNIIKDLEIKVAEVKSKLGLLINIENNKSQPTTEVEVDNRGWEFIVIRTSDKLIHKINAKRTE
jgi:ABC-type Zn2+ transport system substrate-binding protein/surface adhesin